MAEPSRSVTGKTETLPRKWARIASFVKMHAYLHSDSKCADLLGCRNTVQKFRLQLWVRFKPIYTQDIPNGFQVNPLNRSAFVATVGVYFDRLLTEFTLALCGKPHNIPCKRPWNLSIFLCAIFTTLTFQMHTSANDLNWVTRNDSYDHNRLLKAMVAQ